MAKALRTVGKVAGIVAVVAPFFGPVGATVGLVASAVAVSANMGATVLAKPPPARGSVNGITIGTDQPSPYMMGRTYYGGARQYQRGYGPTIDKVPNPYSWIVDVYSVAGPIQGFEGYFADFASLGIPAGGGAASGYASGFLWGAAQLGLAPEASALIPRYAGAPNWGPAYKLSGEAAVGWSLLFDRKGKVFASGVPQLGVIAKGVRVYDPRLDSTFPGGSGAHRIADEATWTWSENPGLHGLAYAYGRYQQGMKVFGVGIPLDGIIVDHFVELANVCDANGWTLGGVIFEPANKWTNLKDILAAGGAEPCFVGGRLGLRISAPRIALDVITEDDLADGEISIGAMQGWEQRLNTLIPKYRSEPHKWEYVQSTTPVTIASYVAEDGETKQEERQFNLVQDKDQAAQLCAYELLDRRELGEISLTCKPRLRRYGPGDLVIVDIEEAGLIQQPCVILKRSVDPERMTVSFVLRGETSTKHAFALGQIGTAPPTPMLRSTQDLDGNAAPISDRAAYLIIRSSDAYPLDSTADTITVKAFDATIDDGRVLSFPAQTITGLDDGSTYVVLWDFAAQAFIAVSAPALNEVASNNFVIIRQMTTQNEDGTYPADPTAPGGDGGGGYGGGGCPVVAERILLANADRTAPGDTIAAGDIQAGDWVWAQLEDEAGSDRFGAYRVTMSRVFESDLCPVDGRPLTSPSHLWWDRGWIRSDALGMPEGWGKVVALSVSKAHTYILVDEQGRWHLSHNKRATQNDA